MGRQETSEQQCSARKCKRVRFNMTPVERAAVAEPLDPMSAASENDSGCTLHECAAARPADCLPGSAAQGCQQVVPPATSEHGSPEPSRVGVALEGTGGRLTRRLDQARDPPAHSRVSRGTAVFGGSGGPQDALGDPDEPPQQEQQEEGHSEGICRADLGCGGLQRGHHRGDAAQGQQQDSPGVRGAWCRSNGVWEVLPAQLPGDLPEGS